ncbi:GTP cyclohydrolase II [Sphingosinithalassobacter tenebrarum]|uniref:GTP cyclohydrolase-2 n=2 Tax=Stakelama tenebrarum TaxID=2711215 RepID=A0A6G6Y9V7_9SPHN|nr:GTP cyclohydrolase II [Sphingosinithalassobacter tenebrarum]
MLRRGRAVIIEDGEAALACIAVELASPRVFDAFADGGEVELLASRDRMAALKAGLEDIEGDAVSVTTEGPMTLDIARAVANPLLDASVALPRLRLAEPGPATVAHAAMRLAKTAELLPALLVRPATATEGPRVSAGDILHYSAPETLRIIAGAELPIHDDEGARLMAFAGAAGAEVHVALILGDPDFSQPTLVRLHSECLTGDVFGSLRCDCGPQLAAAKQTILEAGGGVVLYLRQEGRKIGLANKMRAYALQGRGYDTVDANFHIGFGADDRDYDVAARMLRLMGIEQVRLLTNNPEKVAGLRKAGIGVVERVPLRIAANPHNERYLDTKRDRSGHEL